MPVLTLFCLVVVGGAWLIRDPRPWMLVQILSNFVPVHGFYPKHVAFLSVSLVPVWMGGAADVRIPLIESLSKSSMLASLFVWLRVPPPSWP
jgi:hypothetical protein